jgi:NADH-quinone oxidoreductase subunit N
MPSDFPSVNIGILVPEIILVIVGSAVLLLDAFAPGARSRVLAWFSLAGIILALAYTLDLWGGLPEYAFSDMIVRDDFAVFFKLLTLIGTGLVILYSAGYLEKEDLVHGEYYGLMLFSAAGMMLLAEATDFITIFLGIETLSIALYVLAGFARTNPRSDEAALKYFLLSAFATAVFVYGVALVYGATGATGLSAISQYATEHGIFQNPMLYAGIALVLAGMAFKVALVPFHVWTPDVYEGAPTTVTAFMSFGTKAAAFAALARIFVTGFGNLKVEWVGVMWTLAVLTMLVGNIIAVSQTNLKRLLAYSSIGHAGYILVGLVAGSRFGVSGMAFYLLAYTFMILGALGVVLYLERRGQNLTLDDYSGLASRHPVPAALMAVFMFGLAGIPPTAGFVAKFNIFAAAIREGFVGLAVIGVLTSVIAVYYYLRVIVHMYMRPAEGEMAPPVRSFEASLALVITAAATLLLGLFPSFTLDLVSRVILPGM